MRPLLVITIAGALAILLLAAPVLAVTLTDGPPPLVQRTDTGVGSAFSAQAGWNSEYFSDTVPDTMIIGTQYPVTWTMKNTGSYTWTAAKKIKLGARSAVTQTFGMKKDIVSPSTVLVYSGDTHTFCFNLTAPSTPGVYTLRYRMVKDGTDPLWFGPACLHEVTVTEDDGGVELEVPGPEANLSDKIYYSTNNKRSSLASLPPYRRYADLDDIATAHSEAMAESHIFSHDYAGDGTFDSRLWNYPCASENIVFVSSEYPGDTDAAADLMMRLWVDYDGPLWGHRLNILDGEHSDAKTGNMLGHPYDWPLMGVGSAYGACNIDGTLYDGWFVTQDFASSW